MTRAEKLRAAATRMREAGADAMDGEWAVDENGTAVYSSEVAPYGAPCVVPQVAEEDAEWIALVDPRLAGPLPDLLDTAADLLDAQPTLDGQHPDGNPCDDLACRVVTAALTIADLIGGEA